jgi:cyclopropane fatty-acyl-phospholipid synthase-like methyltransferase
VTLRILQATAVALAAALAADLTAASPQTPRLHPPDVKFVASPQNVVDEMLELAHVTAGDVVYDLGSGDGRIPITAAERYGARGVGIEIDPALVRESNSRLAKTGVADRVRFINQDLFDADLGEATVVAVFLLPHVLDRLLPKLRRELRPGARIVSNQYHFGDEWPPDETRDVYGLTIYLWTIR